MVTIVLFKLPEGHAETCPECKKQSGLIVSPIHDLDKRLCPACFLIDAGSYTTFEFATIGAVTKNLEEMGEQVKGVLKNIAERDEEIKELKRKVASAIKAAGG